MTAPTLPTPPRQPTATTGRRTPFLVQHPMDPREHVFDFWTWRVLARVAAGQMRAMAGARQDGRDQAGGGARRVAGSAGPGTADVGKADLGNTGSGGTVAAGRLRAWAEGLERGNLTREERRDLAAWAATVRATTRAVDGAAVAEAAGDEPERNAKQRGENLRGEDLRGVVAALSAMGWAAGRAGEGGTSREVAWHLPDLIPEWEALGVQTRAFRGTVDGTRVHVRLPASEEGEFPYALEWVWSTGATERHELAGAGQLAGPFLDAAPALWDWLVARAMTLACLTRRMAWPDPTRMPLGIPLMHAAEAETPRAGTSRAGTSRAGTSRARGGEDGPPAREAGGGGQGG